MRWPFYLLAVMCGCREPTPFIDTGLLDTTVASARLDAGRDAGGFDASVDSGVDASVDSGVDASVDAGVDAGFDACVVTARPVALEFAATVPGCVSQEWIVLHNHCATQQVVTLSTSPPFSLDAGTITVAAGAVLDVPISFSPATIGTTTGFATMGASLVLLRGAGVASPDFTDTFPISLRPKADVLIVISDGPGMANTQQWLAAEFGPLLQYAAASSVDFKLAVIPGRADGGSAHFVASSTPNAQQRFAQAVGLGELGSPSSSCVIRAIDELALEAGWLTPGASFSLLCVQNTMEQGAVPTAAWSRTLYSVAGRPQSFSVSAIANFTPGCPSDDTVLRPFISDTFGAAVSICAPGTAAGLGTALFGSRDTFPLSRPATDGGIEVRIDGVVIQDPQVWSYDSSRNAVVMNPLFLPQPGSTLTLSYTAACRP